ncbi:hypothetical protein BC826DRAFT_1187589 [Russula brevipes]|nr:hypothetical protein BC826DRAFT_1187589 [Russula brevipes]
MYIFRGKLELFRFEILAERTLLAREGLLDIAHRKELRASATTGTAQVKVLEGTYMRSSPAENVNMDQLKAARVWFGENCRRRGDKYLKEYSKLATHLLTESGYAPFSPQEKADIVKAFGFSHTAGDTSTTAKTGTLL